MAQTLTAHPLPGSSPAVIRVFHVLKRLPDSYFVAQRFGAIHGGPDFYILHEEQRALVLSICSTTPKEALQPDLFAQSPSEPVGQGAETTLQQFLQTLPLVKGALLFPNLPSDLLTQFYPHNGIMWGGKEIVAPDKLAHWLETHVSDPLPNNLVEQLRRTFSPEVIVPPELTARPLPERRLAANLTGYLLDYNQEQALKAELTLPPEAQATARELNLRLINGIAGSGKSLVVIYRARLLRQLFPHYRILVLTHNRPLIRDLRQRYRRLSYGDDQVAFQTFIGWCRKQWPPQKKWHDPITWRERRQLIAEAWYTHLAGTAISERMLGEEIDWYKDRLLFSLDDYLQADRTGRGFALNESMRQRVYQTMEAYHQQLRQRDKMDWGDVPRQIWRFLESGELVPPQYDVILIDEAQFFAPIWFEIIKRLIKPTGHLFLVADPSQGFLKRRQSWVSSGLEVRGRAHRLDRSYRTTREILDFATLLYRQRLPDDEEEIIVPDMRRMPQGAMPMLLPLTSEQDEISRVVNEIRALHQSGIPWGHILVIHSSWEETRSLLARLQKEFGPETAVDPGYALANNQIRVCSLNSATGLESPIVFLMGLHDLYEQEQSVRLSDEERLELVRDNTRRLYMAITRAGQRLVITYVGPIPDTLQKLLPSNT